MAKSERQRLSEPFGGYLRELVGQKYLNKLYTRFESIVGCAVRRLWLIFLLISEKLLYIL